MNTIPSFEKNHDSLQPGLYFSTLQKGVATYDLRFKKPNSDDYLSPAVSHSIEHMLATALRNGTQKEHILYFGPMGCRTGFYLLTEGLAFCEVYDALCEALTACADMTSVPGALQMQCGNYREHDLAGAKKACNAYLTLLLAMQSQAIQAEEEKQTKAAQHHD